MNLYKDERLMAIACRQLDVSGAEDVPAEYLKELERHLHSNPHDHHFSVRLTPGTGYGVIHCLEKDCQCDIPLTSRVLASDGGKAIGFGSFSAFRAHIRGNTVHLNARSKRVASEQPQDVKPASTNDSSPGSSLLAPSTPRKRPSDMSGETSPASKRSRLGTLPVVPLSPHNGIGRAPSRSGLGMPDKEADDQPPSSQTTMKKRQELRDRVQSLKNSVSRIQSKAMRTPRDETRLKSLEADLAEAEQQLRGLPGGARLLSAIRAAPSSSNLGASGSRTLSKTSLSGSAAATPASSQANAKPVLSPLKLGYAPFPADVKPKIAHSVFEKRPSFKLGAPSIQTRLHFSPPVVKQELDFGFGGLSWSPSSVDVKPVISASATPSAGPSMGAAPLASSSRAGWRDVSPATTTSELPSFDMDVDRSGSSAATSPVLPYPNLFGRNIDPHAYDDDGDFHGRGKDQARGPVAAPEDLNAFFNQAGNAANAEVFDSNATVDKSLVQLGLDSLQDTMPGMEIRFLAHQAIGVSWMVAQEEGRTKGGILADEMGLGKTIQMIATMVKRPPQNIKKRHATLIIVPVALINQWKLEIESKTTNLKVFVYYGPGKPKSASAFKNHDVVITSSSTVALEWFDWEGQEKKAKKKAKKKKKHNFIASDSDSDDDGPSRTAPRKKKDGLLIGVSWHRVIIDEAQCIRNRRTRISRAVTHLDTEYRWCLTGTPIVNSLADAYGYIRFLQVRPWYDWQENFNPRIASIEKKQPDVASSRLQAVFNTILLRRKKDSKLDGKPLIVLPLKDVLLSKLEFSEEERAVYTMVEAKSQAIFNRYLRAGSVLKNYAQVLVLLLRLRQVCSHPSLILENGAAEDMDDAADDPVEHTKQLANARKLVGREFVQKMQDKMDEVVRVRVQAEKDDGEEATVEDDECPICFQYLDEPVVTGCTHIFCRGCVDAVLERPSEHEEGQPKVKKDERPCPVCRSPISREKLFPRKIFEPANELAVKEEEEEEEEEEDEPENDCIEIDSDADGPKTSSKGKGKALVRRPRSQRARRIIDTEDEEDEDDDAADLDDFVVPDDEEEDDTEERFQRQKRLGKQRAASVIDIASDDDEIEQFGDIEIIGLRPRTSLAKEFGMKVSKFLPSTKMKHMMERLKQNLQDHPDEKTMVISQWTSCLTLISNYLSEQHIAHVKYQGDMSRDERDKTISLFMTDDRATVLLMSLRCGGVGLNLTRANRVINIDLGWSEAVEAQAFDRVHRLGQTRDVFIERLVITDTVEDRVLALQERKRNLADGSLGEGSGKKLGRLNVRELANLFGLDQFGHRLPPAAAPAAPVAAAT